MKFIRVIFFLLLSLSHGIAYTQLPGSYDVIWTTQSDHAGSSMPCGGGDIGLNIWVEKDELFIYVSRSGSFDENNALLKSGRLRLKFTPNTLAGIKFRQQLHLEKGYVTVSGENNGVKTEVKIYADVLTPTVHIAAKSSANVQLEARYETWRFEDRVLKSRENFGNSWKWAAPKNNIARKDEIGFENNGVLFYHANTAHTIFDTTVFQQGLDSVKSLLYNPLGNLVSGGYFSGKNFVATDVVPGDYHGIPFRGWTLKTAKASRQQELTLVLHTAQVENVQHWKAGLDATRKTKFTKQHAALREQWWKDFWSRSFIHIDSSSFASTEQAIAAQVARNYQRFRYMLASNAKGEWPTKFNGGLFTVDPVFTDTTQRLSPDFRNWGGGLHTMQNQRLVYYPMIKAGDVELLQPHFKFYQRILRNAELRSRVYWGHEGACFTEQMENFGLPNFAEYGQNRPADFDKGLEYNAWLEYEWDTVLEFCLMMLEQHRYWNIDVSGSVPFIESCLSFFDNHYQYLARKRGRRALDQHGHLVLFPGSAAETFKMANNANSTIAALSTITKRLLELPSVKHDEEKKRKWESFLLRIPPLSFASFNGHPTLAPAKTWERINNTESPQLYPVFPWGIYGVGLPGLDTALNTWKYDTNVVKFRTYVGWKQDNIFAARLGLADEAWKYTSMKLKDGPRRFPAFWGPGYDWVPDHNWGGTGMIGLQEMLLQANGQRIQLFPAWNIQRDVHFKLHAPDQTTVEAKLKGGKLVLLNVMPAAREKDIELPVGISKQ